MNANINRLSTLLLLGAVFTTTNSAYADPPKPEKIIQWRQSAYRVLEWNTARIKASFEGQYNKTDVTNAANTILAISNSGLGDLYVAGTEEGKGWHETSAKPEAFKDKTHFNELANNFSKEAAELVKVANGTDTAAVKSQFGKLTKSCKACHDDFKGKD